MVDLMKKTVKVRDVLKENKPTMVTDLSDLIQTEKFKSQISEVKKDGHLSAQFQKTALAGMSKMCHMMQAEQFSKTDRPSRMESLCQTNTACESSFGKLKWIEPRLSNV